MVAPPESETATQIEVLLRAAMTMSNIIETPPSDNVLEKRNEPSGNVIDSVEATLIRICNRLDGILDDNSRWDLAHQRKVEAATERAHAEQIAFLAAQRAAAEEITTPHFKFRPNLSRLPNGSGWVAFIGDAFGDPENALAGIGKTPKSAVDAFDAIFNGDLPVQMMEWIKEREAAINAGQIPPEKPNTNNAKSPESMDDGGSKPSRKTPRRRKDPQ